MRTAVSMAATALLLLVTAFGAIAQEGTGTVTVVHAVPDTTVDVYVNGDLTLEGFEPKTITDPLELPAGDYDIAIRPAGADAASDPVIATDSPITLPAGANAAIVAHLTEAGDPTLSVFVNDTSTIDAGNARVSVRHTAAAPAVDVTANGDVLISSLANGNAETADVPADTYSVAVQPAGTSDPVIGPTDLTLEEGTAYLVYAYGSAEAGNLDLLVDTISGLHGAPSGVPSGNGGQAADGTSGPALALLSAGLVLVGLSARRLQKVRA